MGRLSRKPPQHVASVGVFMAHGSHLFNQDNSWLSSTDGFLALSNTTEYIESAGGRDSCTADPVKRKNQSMMSCKLHEHIVTPFLRFSRSFNSSC